MGRLGRSGTVVVAPFLCFCRTQITQVRWISPVSPGTVLEIVYEQYFDQSAAFAIAAALLLAATVVLRRFALLDNGSRQLAALAVAWIVLPTFVLVSYSAVAKPDLLPPLPLLHLTRGGTAARAVHLLALPDA